MSVHDTKNPETREDALAAAVDAVRGGDLIVLPTDTVYGIGADAFTPDAVDALLEAKGRGRDTPPPVLIGDHAVLLALAADVPDYVEDLTDELWPGALTLILTAQPSLTWDLGETRGTVALRMPDDEVALELLRRTGPLAVSSANRHGRPAALTVLDAATQLGDSVEVYLDGGVARVGTSSTILDTTVTPAQIVREGAITKAQIIEIVGDIFTAPVTESDEDPTKGETPEEQAAEAPAGTADGAADGADTALGADAPTTGASQTDASTTDAPTTGSPSADASNADVPSSDASTARASDGDDDAVGATAATPTSPVLDLPSEPEQPADAPEAAAETPLSRLGGAADPAAGDDASADRPAENTPG